MTRLITYGDNKKHNLLKENDMAMGNLSIFLRNEYYHILLLDTPWTIQ